MKPRIRRYVSWYALGVLAVWWGLSVLHFLGVYGDAWPLGWVLAWSLALPLPFVVFRALGDAAEQRERARRERQGRSSPRTP